MYVCHDDDHCLPYTCTYSGSMRGYQNHAKEEEEEEQESQVGLTTTAAEEQTSSSSDCMVSDDDDRLTRDDVEGR